MLGESNREGIVEHHLLRDCPQELSEPPFDLQQPWRHRTSLHSMARAATAEYALVHCPCYSQTSLLRLFQITYAHCLFCMLCIPAACEYSSQDTIKIWKEYATSIPVLQCNSVDRLLLHILLEEHHKIEVPLQFS